MPIHRSVLMANSKVFKSLLKPDSSEQDEFTVNETDAEMLNAIVSFCYKGRIGLTEENVMKYLAIAFSVDFYRLEQECWRFLTEKISVNNAVQTLAIAEKYSHHDASQRALHFICGSIEKFSIESFQAFDHQLLQKVLKSNSTEATEEFIFKRLLDWFRFNEDERKQYMGALLRLVRLEFIPPQVCFVT